MQHFSLFLARTAITAWVGAAVLFVVVGVSEVVYPGFSSEVRDQLVIIRFPWYYAFGFALLTAGLIAVLGTPPCNDFPSRQRGMATFLIAAALILMTAEYFAVYLKLVEFVTPPGKPRPPEFTAYHKTSMWVNTVELVLCIMAVGLLNWPASSDKMQQVSASETSP